jgi:hypothetical protein
MATLFIGIGSSGLKVLEEAQQFNYEFTGKNKPSNVHYLYLETDLSNKPRKTPLGTNDIIGVELSLKDMSNSISKFRANNRIDSSWIPDPTTALSTSGAGGKSAYGRLSLWANFGIVKQKILDLNKAASGFDAVYVTGSLTGGTGSGVLIDLAYLIRQFVNPQNLFSILMMPKETDLNQNTSNFFINSYYSIKGLEYYSKQGSTFEVMWPDNTPLPNSIGLKAPFDTNIIVSPDYFNQSTINNTFMCDYTDLTPLFKTIGLYISLLGNENNGEQGLQDVASARWIDGAASAEHISHFVSIGLSMIQYPKALLEEFAALEYADKIVDDWLGDKYNNKEVQIKHKAKKETEDSVNYIITNDLNNINHQSTSSINNFNISLTGKLAKNKFEPYNSLEELLFNTYKADGDSNVYTQIKNNLFIARDSFIKQVADKFSNVVKSIPNLKIAKYYLESTVDHVDSLIGFWKDEYKIDDNPSNWNRLLSVKIKELDAQKSSYETFGLKKEYILEQLDNITMLMKFHLLINELDIFKKHLKTPDTILKTTDGNVCLPSIKEIDFFTDSLLTVKDNPGVSMAFNKRKEFIKTMSDSYGMIFNIYPSGDFSTEISNLKSNIDLQKVINQNIILKNDSMWHFLMNSKNLYFDILAPMTRTINQNNNQGKVYIEELVSNHPNNYLQTLLSSDTTNINASAPALVKLDQNIGSRSVFQDSTFLKTIYLFNDLTTMNNIRNSIRKDNNETSDNLDNQTFSKNSNLINSIAIFKSYAYFGGNQDQMVEDKSLIPTRDLTSLKNVKEQFISVRNLNRIERIPYFNEDQIKQNLI